MRRYKNTPYFVSEDGNVFREGKSKPLKPDVAEAGYRRVTLSFNGRTERLLVHRMVAEVYLVKPIDAVEVNHRNNIPGNDWKNNLEWTTKSGNMIYAHRQGRCSNLIASQQASVVATNKTIEYFSKKLGDNFIEVVNLTPRNFIRFRCAECTKELFCRADSSVFKQETVKCRYCQ